MRFWPRRKPPTPAGPRANPTRTALLEHALNGTEPAPGSAAAISLALRRAGICVEHKPVIASSGDRAVCAGCSNEMRQRQDGAWFVVRQPGTLDFWNEESSDG